MLVTQLLSYNKLLVWNIIYTVHSYKLNIIVGIPLTLTKFFLYLKSMANGKLTSHFSNGTNYFVELNRVTILAD